MSEEKLTSGALALASCSGFFVIAQDPETYEAKAINGDEIVKVWTELMFCPVDLANPSEVEEFKAFADDQDNWHTDCEGYIASLTYDVPGESGGTITFVRRTDTDSLRGMADAVETNSSQNVHFEVQGQRAQSLDRWDGVGLHLDEQAAREDEADYRRFAEERKTGWADFRIVRVTMMREILPNSSLCEGGSA